jgi:hypothetical protein
MARKTSIERRRFLKDVPLQFPALTLGVSAFGLEVVITELFTGFHEA